MNKDIIKGKWREMKGGAKETWGKFTNDVLAVIEGKDEKLLGMLQKKYGYIRDKAQPEYEDSVELVVIVSRIREIQSKKAAVSAIADIARYGRPLLAKKQNSEITGSDQKRGGGADQNFNARLPQRVVQRARMQNAG